MQSSRAEAERLTLDGTVTGPVVGVARGDEHVVAFEVARALTDKFGNDSLEEMKARWTLYQDMARQR